jgi:hypothetical protein
MGLAGKAKAEVARTDVNAKATSFFMDDSKVFIERTY